MAYSDYGAYIWKNGKNITKECADIDCKIIDGKFVLGNWYDALAEKVNNELNNEVDNTPTIDGHAVLVLGDYCLSFYKTYNPQIHYLDGSKKELHFGDGDFRCNNLKKEGIKILKYELGYSRIGVYKYTIDYKDDKYCVIVGSSVGNGYDSNPLSKYLLKNTVLFTREDGSVIYYIKTKRDVDQNIVIDKLDRLNDIRFEKYWRNLYIKQIIKCIFTFKFKQIPWRVREILGHNEQIKWLK